MTHRLLGFADMSSESDGSRLAAYLSRRHSTIAFSVTIVFVILLATWLRLGSLDVILFSHDEAEWSNGALSIARGEHFPLIGITSLVNVNTGPFFLYLLALPMLFSTDPSFVTGFIGALNVLSVGALALFTRRYFGPLVAIVATALYAAAPWAVYHSRKIWNPNVLPLVSIVFFWALCEALIRRRSRFLVLASAACAIAIQLNQAGLLLVPVLIIVFIVAWRQLSVGVVLGSLAVVLGLSSSLLYFEWLNGWPSLKQGLAVAGGSSSQWDLEAARLAIASVAGWGFPGDIFGIWTRPGEQVPGFEVSSAAVTILLALGLLVAVWRAWRLPEQRTAYLLLLAWATVPPLLFARHGFEMHMRYLLTAQPAGFVLAGLGACAALSALSRRLSGLQVRRQVLSLALATLALVGLVMAQTADYHRVLAMIDRNGLERSYGVPLKFYKQTTANLKSAAESGAYGAMVARVDSSMYQPLRYLARADRLDLRLTSSRSSLLLPPTTGDTSLVDSYSHDEPERAITAVGGRELAELAVAVQGGQQSFRFFAFPANPALLGKVETSSPQSGPGLSNGLSHIANASNYVDNALTFNDAWLVDRDPRLLAGDPTLCMSKHLLAADGRDLVAIDSEIEALSNLRKGDRLLTWATLKPDANLEPQVVTVHTSLFGCWKREYATFAAADGSQQSSFSSGRVLLDTATEPPPPRRALSVALAEGITLQGYELARQGTDLVLRLHWRASALPATDYTVFAQLIGNSGVISQSDSQPAGGRLPTSLWPRERTIVDEHRLPLPGTNGDERVRLIVGMYDLTTMKRLPVTQAGQGNDHIALGDFSMSELVAAPLQ